MAPNDNTPSDEDLFGTGETTTPDLSRPYAAEPAPEASADSAAPASPAPRKRATRRTTKKAAAVAVVAPAPVESTVDSSVDPTVEPPTEPASAVARDSAAALISAPLMTWSSPPLESLRSWLCTWRPPPSMRRLSVDS